MQITSTTPEVKKILNAIIKEIPKAIQSFEQANPQIVSTPRAHAAIRGLRELRTTINTFKKSDDSINSPTFDELYSALIRTVGRTRRYAQLDPSVLQIYNLYIDLKRRISDTYIKTKTTNSNSQIHSTDSLSSLAAQYNEIARKLAATEKKIDIYTINLDHLSEASEISRLKAETKFNEAAEKVQFGLLNLDKFIEDKKHKLEILESELNDQQGLLSGKMLAGGYAQQAEEERKSANSMRNASVLCLVTILAVVIYSLVELSGGEITIERSLVKLGLLLFLLAPAAYLARESTKHRNEHYALRQTALDLNAIGPYIASLNQSDQDMIKTKIAERLFCVSKNKQDENTFPINAHEVIIKLIERFEPVPKPATETAKSKSASD